MARVTKNQKQMTHYTVTFTPRAERQLDISMRTLRIIATKHGRINFRHGIVADCLSLSTFSRARHKRDDIRPLLRTTCYKRRVTLPFSVTVENQPLR